VTLGDPGLETPLAPLPAPVEAAPPAPAPPARPPGAPGALGAAAAGARFALRAWRPLLAVLVVQILLALTVAVPFQAGLGARLDAHPHARALAGAPTKADRALGWEAGMDAGLWRDARRGLEPLFEALPVVLFWVLLVAWLFGAVAAGGFLALATEPGSASVGRFFAGGGRWFGRMARVGIVFFVVFLLVGRLVHEGWGAAVLDRETAAASGGVRWWGERAREFTLLGAFLVLRVVGDLARADLVLTGRRSAFLAFFRRFGTVLRHPVKTLGAALLVGLPAFAALWLLSLLLPDVPGGGWGGIVALFLVLQLAVLLRWASRAAVLAADARLLAR
jgi:hypothetical protein